MKNNRILEIYFRLLNNQRVSVKELAAEKEVSERTILRDISDLKNFLQEKNSDIVYDRKEKAYILKDEDSQKLNKSEILGITKILLESRAFLKGEMYSIIDKLIKQCSSEKDYKLIYNLINNEKFHYLELQHKKSFINKLWDLGEAIQKHKKIELIYTNLNKNESKQIIKPIGLMFSEFYFYLLAYTEEFYDKEESCPIIYRVDRIKKFKILDKNFSTHLSSKNRFEEGEFRKKISFMRYGELREVKFKCHKNSLEAVLDKIPTAKIKEESEGYYLIIAKVFGYGIDMWLRSQGDNVEVL